ncbi:MAG TPA: glycosyltransferase family 2 protein, partial [Luteitalea sp.]|nr:glycosyltransferase family 2 protein [Luteitalea sp.]
MPEAVSIIVPVFNEEGAIVSTIAAIDETMRAIGREYEVLVVDDGSTDGTAQALTATTARVVRHRANRGYGAALKSGLRATSYPLVAILDADGTYPIARLPDLLARVADADMVVG